MTIDFHFIVTVTTDTAENAERVMNERLDFFDDYGFPYTVEYVNGPTTAPALTEKPTLWVLTLAHQYGTDVFIYPTEADARKHVARYVSEWWTTETGLEGEMPEDQDEAIDAYYATVGEESFLITETTIKETA